MDDYYEPYMRTEPHYFSYAFTYTLDKNLYCKSHNLVHTWSVVVILFLITATVFIRYVLPWGQISFWGATVITHLLSAITYIRKEIVQIVWGGFTVDNATLIWFFLCITLPITIHNSSNNNNPPTIPTPNRIKYLTMAKQKHRQNSIASILHSKGYPRICTHNYNTNNINSKRTLYPGRPRLLYPANPLVTPVHIQPEWYFHSHTQSYDKFQIN